MAEVLSYNLIQDRKGMAWDLLLYAPTVIALFSIGLKLWFGPNQAWAYLLFFLGCFFFIAGANRILSSRLMVLPSSPRALMVGKHQVTLVLRNGERVDLAKEVRFYPDYAGKSFGLAGLDLSGRRRQFVFHRGQFADASQFKTLLGELVAYK